MKIELLRGDITKVEIDAIVNSANTSLLGEGDQMEQFIEQEEKTHIK